MAQVSDHKQIQILLATKTTHKYTLHEVTSVHVVENKIVTLKIEIKWSDQAKRKKSIENITELKLEKIMDWWQM